MTGHPDPTDPIPPSFLVIEAFADGDRVDPGALKDALADPSARDFLIDLLMLRDAVAEMSPVSWGVVRRATAGRGRAWLVAAAALLVGIASGYFAAELVTMPAAEASSIVVHVDSAAAPPPPAPTEVIVLQRGVNWTDNRAGN